MKKIFTVHDGQHWSQGTVDLACYLSKLSRAKLTGIFPGYLSEDEQDVFARFIDETAPSTILAEETASGIEDAVSQFQKACMKQDVDCFVHRDNGDPENDIITQTMFADLLIADTTLSFAEEEKQFPSHLVYKLLAYAACPIIISSANFQVPKEIIFAYDGTDHSMFALKQFTYLFPEMKDKTLVVVEITNDGETKESGKLGEWLEGNYDEVVFEVIQGNATDRLLEIVMVKHDAILVLGAFGRSTVSKFFKPSAAENVLKYSTVPVFIAHN